MEQQIPSPPRAVEEVDLRVLLTDRSYTGSEAPGFEST